MEITSRSFPSESDAPFEDASSVCPWRGARSLPAESHQTRNRPKVNGIPLASNLLRRTRHPRLEAACPHAAHCRGFKLSMKYPA